MATQYVKVSFRPGGPQYTYVNNEPITIRPGDFLEVEGKSHLNGFEALEVSDTPFADVPSHITLKECWKGS